MSQRTRNGVSRRDALRIGAVGLTGWTMAGLLEAAEKAPAAGGAAADRVLFLNLAGGPSHLDTLDMKPDGPSETKGEFQPIASKLPGVVVCEHLPKLAATLDQYTLVRGISHTTGDHPQGQAYIASGNRPSPAIKHPALGSMVNMDKPGDPFLRALVAFQKTEWNAGYLGDAYAAFKTNATPKPGQPFSVRGITLPQGLTLEKVKRREALLKDVDRAFRDLDQPSSLLDALDAFQQQAYSIITSERTRQAFDVAAEPESIRDQFGGDELNQSLLLGVRLLEFGVPFVTVTNQGWDTHLDNFTGHKRLLAPLDAGLTAAVNVLREKGLLERTLVVVMGEFGRTPKINQNVGRDHFPRANWCLFAGGGSTPGALIGGTNAAGDAADDATDIHPDDVAATILNAVGIDHHKEYFTRTGRPAILVPDGKPLY
ncbi:MAG: DUF1501 domain-containing protein [Pirellulaceae bacterium]|nr:DUF1501 domain-containing protein [Pirellulaceae bacterium]